ncbi:hypothetical protein Tco_0555854 [Tanacetum coccineum]
MSEGKKTDHSADSPSRIKNIKESQRDYQNKKGNKLVIADEDAMDMGLVAVSRALGQAKSKKTQSAASGSAHPPRKMMDEGHVSDLEDTDNAHIPKVLTTTWFKPIPEGERITCYTEQMDHSLRMMPENQRNNWATTLRHHVSCSCGRTSFKGRTLILGHSSNGSAKNRKEESSAKLI